MAASAITFVISITFLIFMQTLLCRKIKLKYPISVTRYGICQHYWVMTNSLLPYIFDAEQVYLT